MFTCHGTHQVIGVWGFRPPLYNSPTLLLSTGLSVHAARALWRLRPDVIHVSGPGPMVFAALLYARLFGAPLVMSYHTHIPEYIPRYTWRGLVGPAWAVIRWFVRAADLTLVTSAAMKVCVAQQPAGFIFGPRVRVARVLVGRVLV
jgi:sulfoquinovosyltransferase